MDKHVYIHEVKLKGDTPFIEQFNSCSDYFEKATNPNTPIEEAKEYWKAFMFERYRLETGGY